MNMLGIAFLNVTPVVYGIVIFAAIGSMLSNLRNLRLTPLLVETGVFSFVLYLTGPSIGSGFAASVAALLAGWILPKMFRRRAQRVQ